MRFVSVVKKNSFIAAYMTGVQNKRVKDECKKKNDDKIDIEKEKGREGKKDQKITTTDNSY